MLKRTLLYLLLLSLPVSNLPAQEFEQHEVNQDLVERCEKFHVGGLIQLPTVTQEAQKTPQEPITEEDIRDIFPIFPRPKPDEGDKEEGPKDPKPEKPEEKPETPDDKYLFPILGRLFWGLLGMPAVQIILTIAGLALLSQAVFKPIYGEAWLKGVVLDVFEQVKGLIEAIVEIVKSIFSMFSKKD